MYCTFNWQRLTLSVMYILLIPSGIVATYFTRTFHWHPLTVCIYCTVHCIPSFIRGEFHVRLAGSNPGTSQAVMYTYYTKLGSNFGTRKLLSFFLFFDGGRCGDVEWMTWSQTYFTNKKTVTCTSSPVCNLKVSRQIIKVPNV